DGFEVYNNVFDGSGGIFGAIELNHDSVMPSLRNNVFYNFTASVIVGVGSKPKADGSLSEQLGYADYNLFYNPKAQKIDNYACGVKGKAERKDAGFALNDIPKAGAVDAQADPKFKGPIPEKFAFDVADIKSGKVTVSQILKHYREAYSPQPGSPLIDAGDPADGAGTDIGAVSAGK
ncbi:MAG TPA: hypothetical protein VEJ63_03665, partial [Planctomycetota bacterium]|nr:hypothetical protein [Planctomycetota bacterium]